ncbi:12232_t:CDS:2 [Entrophospora sp. SA101]|nr:12232_t:CDS:2 [Entrophospora sp. SA101]
MRVYCDQEKWSNFCKLYPTEPACRNLVLNTYQYYSYYKQSKSKELFQKWLKEGKIEDNSTLKGILEKGHEG